MQIGWPLTIMLVIVVGSAMVLYTRGEARHRQRKLDIVQKRLAAIEAKKKQETKTQASKEHLD